MHCIPARNVETDVAFWVAREIFWSAFDQDDFHCRDVQMVDLNYCKHWFYIDESGNTRFLMPSVQVISGKTQFISGRHRTAVLYEKTDRVPMAFAGEGAFRLAKSLGLESVSEAEVIEVPDLPIVDRPEY